MADHEATALRLGPPAYYRPVCYLTPWGFIGGPWRYRAVETEEESRRGPVIVDIKGKEVD
jgi:hypothetical protein